MVLSGSTRAPSFSRKGTVVIKPGERTQELTKYMNEIDQAYTEYKRVRSKLGPHKNKTLTAKAQRGSGAGASGRA